MAKLNYNDHLDDLMERLMAEDITQEDLENEIKKAKAIVMIAGKKIEDKKVNFQIAKAISNGNIDNKYIPTEFQENLKIENKK